MNVIHFIYQVRTEGRRERKRAVEILDLARPIYQHIRPGGVSEQSEQRE